VDGVDSQKKYSKKYSSSCGSFAELLAKDEALIQQFSRSKVKNNQYIAV
jgi:hypothetical protein